MSDKSKFYMHYTDYQKQDELNINEGCHSSSIPLVYNIYENSNADIFTFNENTDEGILYAIEAD